MGSTSEISKKTKDKLEERIKKLHLIFPEYNFVINDGKENPFSYFNFPHIRVVIPLETVEKALKKENKTIKDFSTSDYYNKIQGDFEYIITGTSKIELKKEKPLEIKNKLNYTTNNNNVEFILNPINDEQLDLAYKEKLIISDLEMLPSVKSLPENQEKLKGLKPGEVIEWRFKEGIDILNHILDPNVKENETYISISTTKENKLTLKSEDNKTIESIYNEIIKKKEEARELIEGKIKRSWFLDIFNIFGSTLNWPIKDIYNPKIDIKYISREILNNNNITNINFSGLNSVDYTNIDYNAIEAIIKNLNTKLRGGPNCIKYLNFSNNNIDNETAEKILNLIKKYGITSEIDLKGNTSINKQTLDNINNALKDNKSYYELSKRLNLLNSELKKEEMFSFGKILDVLEKQINIYFNLILIKMRNSDSDYIKQKNTVYNSISYNTNVITKYLDNKINYFNKNKSISKKIGYITEKSKSINTVCEKNEKIHELIDELKKWYKNNEIETTVAQLYSNNDRIKIVLTRTAPSWKNMDKTLQDKYNNSNDEIYIITEETGSDKKEIISIKNDESIEKNIDNLINTLKEQKNEIQKKEEKKEDIKNNNGNEPEENDNNDLKESDESESDNGNYVDSFDKKKSE